MAEIIEINDPEKLSSYHVAWTALHAQTRGASFFNTLEWLQTFWKHFGEQRRLRVLVAQSAGRPIGFVPLCEQLERSTLGTKRVLTYPLDDWAAAYGAIGPWPAATLTLAMRHIAATPRTWDAVQTRWTSATTHDNGRTERAMRLAGLSPVATPHVSTSLVECHRFGGWNDYLASRTKKIRHEIRRQRRQLERSGRVEHVTHRPAPFRHGDGDPRIDLYDECLRVSRSSWQANSTTGNTLCHPKIAPFLADAHRQAARLGMLDLHLLRFDGRPVAYFYAYHCEGRVTGIRMGYDPAGPRGAGAVLLGRVIETAFARGDSVVDLGVGEESYKHRLRTATEVSTNLTHGGLSSWRARAQRIATDVATRWSRGPLPAPVAGGQSA